MTFTDQSLGRAHLHGIPTRSTSSHVSARPPFPPTSSHLRSTLAPFASWLRSCWAHHKLRRLDPRMAKRNHLLLDGGMGHQLKAMGVKIEGVVGSMERFLGVALANEQTPNLVRDAHLLFIDAGAAVITTNNYAVVPAALELSENHSGDSAELQRLVMCAGAAARAAVDARPNRSIHVAGCLPPLHESYRADRVGTFEENVAQYRLIAAAIAPYADVLLCETMSTAQEALAAATAA